MQVAVVGKGLIGGSFEKAAVRAGHEAVVFDKGDDFRVEGADVVFTLPPLSNPHANSDTQSANSSIAAQVFTTYERLLLLAVFSCLYCFLLIIS